MCIIAPDNYRSKTTAALLAFFLGHFGIQRFYLGRPVSGFVLLCLCWTGIPSLWGFIESILLFTMSENTFRFKYPQKIYMPYV